MNSQKQKAKMTADKLAWLAKLPFRLDLANQCNTNLDNNDNVCQS